MAPLWVGLWDTIVSCFGATYIDGHLDDNTSVTGPELPNPYYEHEMHSAPERTSSWVFQCTVFV